MIPKFYNKTDQNIGNGTNKQTIKILDILYVLHFVIESLSQHSIFKTDRYSCPMS